MLPSAESSISTRYRLGLIVLLDFLNPSSDIKLKLMSFLAGSHWGASITALRIFPWGLAGTLTASSAVFLESCSLFQNQNPDNSQFADRSASLCPNSVPGSSFRACHTASIWLWSYCLKRGYGSIRQLWIRLELGWAEWGLRRVAPWLCQIYLAEATKREILFQTMGQEA